MPNPKKIKLVEELQNTLKEKPNFALIHYGSLSHQEMEKLRKEMRKFQSRIKVVKKKNNKKAVNKLSNSDKFFRTIRIKLFPLKHNTAFVKIDSDPYEALKVIYKFLKEYENLYFKGGVIEKNVYNKDELTQLAQLPSKQELIAKIYSAIQSPMYRTTYALKFNLLKITLSIKKLAEEKKGGEN